MQSHYRAVIIIWSTLLKLVPSEFQTEDSEEEDSKQSQSNPIEEVT